MSPVQAPQHVLELLSKLHQTSLEQEAGLMGHRRVYSSKLLDDLKDQYPGGDVQSQFDRLMLDKFIALDQEKCEFVYQLIIAMGATNIIEAGTGFGVSTIYLALAAAKSRSITGKSGVLIATEKEKTKARIAQDYWAQCGPEVARGIELREGDLLETLKTGLPVVDLLLLDSMASFWFIRSTMLTS